MRNLKSEKLKKKEIIMEMETIPEDCIPRTIDPFYAQSWDDDASKFASSSASDCPSVTVSVNSDGVSTIVGSAPRPPPEFDFQPFLTDEKYAKILRRNRRRKEKAAAFKMPKPTRFKQGTSVLNYVRDRQQVMSTNLSQIIMSIPISFFSVCCIESRW